MPEERRTFKERYQQARENMKHNKTVQWLQANKVPIGMGVVGGITMGYFLTAGKINPLLENAPRNSGLLYKSSQTINNTVVQEMVRQGHPGRKTLWVEKNLWFPSRALAGHASGVSTSSVSKCANGIVDSVKGQHFVDGGDMI